MTPWSIKNTAEWKAYNALIVRPSWWPAFSTTGNDNVIAVGEVWCRVRDQDGHFCSSEKFASTPNLRKHVEKYHGGSASSSDGVVSISQRSRLVGFYRSLVVQPVSVNVSTFGTPKKTLKNSIVPVTPVPAPNFVTPGVGPTGPAVRPPMPANRGAARALAGFPNGCTACGAQNTNTRCPRPSKASCQVRLWFGVVPAGAESDSDSSLSSLGSRTPSPE